MLISLDNLGTLVAIGSSLGLLFIALVGIGFRLGTLTNEMKNLRDDVNLLKNCLFRRAGVELIHKGWGIIESPLHLGEIAIDAVIPLLGQLLPFYFKLVRDHPQITDQELFWALEKNFSELIIEKLCVPHGLSNLGCLMAVMETCKLASQGKVEVNHESHESSKS